MRHTLYWDRHSEGGTPPPNGQVVEIAGDEAMHATKSKRLREGDGCVVCDGAGVVVSGVVVRATKSRVEVEVVSSEVVAPLRPRVEVFGATPKGQRLDKMLDMLGQCGCALWRPLSTSRGVVAPGAHKLERARRISVEALKQSGGAHLMAIGEEVSFTDALTPTPGTRIVLADGTGEQAVRGLGEGVGTVRLLVGPEGGFTDEERAMALEQGRATCVSLGPLVMRIETASVVGAAWAMGLGSAGA